MIIEDHKNPDVYFIDIKPGTCFKREEETNSIYMKVRTTIDSVAIAVDLKNGDIVIMSPKNKIIPLCAAKIVIE